MPTPKSPGQTLSIFNIKGKEVEKYGLDLKVFDGKVNPTLMHQAVVTNLANKRKGCASTKTKGEVRGGGKKPWRQKGTGRARVGSSRSPIWRGGGVTFGPRPRSYRKDFPKKMKVLALKSALNQKFRDQKILILDNFSLDSHKTKKTAEVLSKLKLSGEKIRLVLEMIENNSRLATRNIKKVLIAKASNVNTTEVLDCKRLVLTKKALQEVEERVKKCLK